MILVSLYVKGGNVDAGYYYRFHQYFRELDVKVRHNKMYDEVFNKEYKLNNMDANELLINKKKNNDLNFSIEEFKLLLSTVNNDAFVMRELALEEVRKEKYPNYPSRLNCLYVTKEKQAALEWTNILKRNHKECKQILTLELTGDLYKFDGNLMRRQNVSYEEQLKRAEEYWNSTSDNPEYLFYGEAKVVDIEEL